MDWSIHSPHHTPLLYVLYIGTPGGSDWPEKLVTGGAVVHERVGNDGGRVTDRVPHSILRRRHGNTKCWTPGTFTFLYSISALMLSKYISEQSLNKTHYTMRLQKCDNISMNKRKPSKLRQSCCSKGTTDCIMSRLDKNHKKWIFNLRTFKRHTHARRLSFRKKSDWSIDCLYVETKHVSK